VATKEFARKINALGCEYKPAGDTREGLRWLQEVK
jgi:hydroxypyruvate isomerase